MDDNKIDRFMKAFFNLKETDTDYTAYKEAVYRDALIKRFEYVFELAWVNINEYLVRKDGEMSAGSAKDALRKALDHDMIEDEKWMRMLDDRNILTHCYENRTLNDISARIQNDYIKLFEKLTAYFIANIIQNLDFSIQV
jgi:nucleotidyltransferase substrate binding protein (TIGR01987 family)